MQRIAKILAAIVFAFACTDAAAHGGGSWGGGRGGYSGGGGSWGGGRGGYSGGGGSWVGGRGGYSGGGGSWSYGGGAAAGAAADGALIWAGAIIPMVTAITIGPTTMIMVTAL